MPSHDPILSFDGTVNRLLQIAKEEGREDVLDDLVQDVTAQMAQKVNNQGTEAQIRFLLVHMGLTEGTVRRIRTELEQ